MIIRFVTALLLTLMVAFAASKAAAQVPTPQRLRAIEASWKNWARQNRVVISQLAVSYRGESVLVKGQNIATSKAMKLASLSKAITGACILQLEKDKKLTRDTTIGSLRTGFSGEIFPDNETADLTVTQFLTHMSGLKPDITQGRMANWLDRSANEINTITTDALDSLNLDGDRDDFFYNNGNYAALGSIIEKVTDEDGYEKACKKALEKRDGIEGLSLGLRMKAFASMGGWISSAKNFLAFANDTFGLRTDFQKDPFSLPNTKISRGLYYGPGVYFRKNRRVGYNIWHFGQVCFPDPAEDGGAYFAVYGLEWSVAVTHNACLKAKGMFALDAALARGVFGKL